MAVICEIVRDKVAYIVIPGVGIWEAVVTIERTETVKSMRSVLDVVLTPPKPEVMIKLEGQVNYETRLQ